jgi:hypothetical protein
MKAASTILAGARKWRLDLIDILSRKAIERVERGPEATQMRIAAP